MRVKIKTIEHTAVAAYLSQEALSILKPAADLIHDKSAPVTERPTVANEKASTRSTH